MENPNAKLKNYKRYEIQQFKPGRILYIKCRNILIGSCKHIRYHSFPFNTNVFANKYDQENILDNIQIYFKEAYLNVVLLLTNSHFQAD